MRTALFIIIGLFYILYSYCEARKNNEILPFIMAIIIVIGFAIALNTPGSYLKFR